MFLGIPVTKLRDRPVIEIPNPVPVLDKKGNLILSNGKPQFTVKAENMDHMIGKQSPVRRAFSERFIIKSGRATPTQLAVFFFLANTTDWSEIQIVVGGDNKPLLNNGGRAQAIITTYGNRSATRTVQEIADAIGATYGAAQKALTFWEKASVMKRIREYRRSSPKANESDAGRPVDHRRYEFNPEYVWNGYIWIGNAYSDFLLGPVEVVS